MWEYGAPLKVSHIHYKSWCEDCLYPSDIQVEFDFAPGNIKLVWNNCHYSNVRSFSQVT